LEHRSSVVDERIATEVQAEPSTSVFIVPVVDVKDHPPRLHRSVSSQGLKWRHGLDGEREAGCSTSHFPDYAQGVDGPSIMRLNGPRREHEVRPPNWSAERLTLNMNAPPASAGEANASFRMSTVNSSISPLPATAGGLPDLLYR